MPRTNWRRHLPAAGVGLLILVAWCFRFTGRFSPLTRYIMVLVRTGIHTGIFIVWGFSVNRRVIHRQTKRLITAAAGLMVFWFTVRTARFLLPECAAQRYLWYLYYIPMLYIPLLTALTAGSLGRAEDYRMPRWIDLLFVLAGVLALFVLTNDLHQLVFVFPGGVPDSGENGYGYGAGFIPVALWRYSGFLFTLGLVFHRSRLPGRGKRLLLPVLPAVLLVLYHLIYLLGSPWLRVIFGDLTVTECLLVIGILESCLQTGLIPSNTHYIELFRIGSGNAVIVDEEYRERITSGEYTSLPPETLRLAEGGPVMLDGGLRLSSAPVQGGHVLWVEDICELLEITADLANKSDYLTGQVVMQRKEAEARHREQSLEQRNLLYDRVIGEMKGAIDFFSLLTDELEACADSEAEALLTAKLAIVCTQIKRSVNLVFIEESQGQIDAGEICNAIGEWMASLRLAGVRCASVFDRKSSLPISVVLLLYYAIARILLAALPGLQALVVHVPEREKAPLILMDLCCPADLSRLEAPGISVTQEDEGEWALELTIPEGGQEP